jgi:hypothetical protein
LKTRQAVHDEWLRRWKKSPTYWDNRLFHLESFEKVGVTIDKELFTQLQEQDRKEQDQRNLELYERNLKTDELKRFDLRFAQNSLKMLENVNTSDLLSVELEIHVQRLVRCRETIQMINSSLQ